MTSKYPDELSKVFMPAHLRNQLRKHFGKELNKYLDPIDDDYARVSLADTLLAFDVLDDVVGRHWPLTATNLWRHGSHVVVANFIETSRTVGDAMRGIFSTSTTIYPIFSTSAAMSPRGLVVSSRPTYPIEDRHWHIFQTLSVLTQTATYKRFAPEATQKLECNISPPEDELAEPLRKLATCKVNFGFEKGETYYVYPHELLSASLPYPHETLNELLFAELLKQAAAPDARQNKLSELRVLLKASFPDVPSAQTTAEKLGLSRSTLHRILREHGTSFQEILRQERREFVLLCFAGATSETDLLEITGFTSARALNSFCKKQFGTIASRMLRQIKVKA